MKTRIKLLGFIVLVAIIGFSFAACGDDGGGGDSPLNGVWYGETGNVVAFNGNSAVFKEINSPDWKEIQNRGNINIGDQKMRNISRIGDLQWSCQDRGYSNYVPSWYNAMITMSANGNTIQVRSTEIDDQFPFTYTR